MKKEDVPQYSDLSAGCKAINYATDANGQYTLAQSAGWEVKDIALRQAWDAIDEQLREVLREINAGRKSPLAYHMIKNQMDPALLAKYSGISRWQVKRHLKPRIFNKLSESILAPYLELFNLTIDQLRAVPEQPEIMPADQERRNLHGEN